MNDKNMMIAEAYYNAIKDKNSVEMGKYLDPDVQYISPLAEMTGKEVALTAAEKLFPLLDTLIIRAKFESETQAVIVFDMKFLPSIGTIPIAALLNIRNKLITKIEMFLDPQQLMTKRDEIFS
jgi:hypothetical protein